MNGFIQTVRTGEGINARNTGQRVPAYFLFFPHTFQRIPAGYEFVNMLDIAGEVAFGVTIGCSRTSGINLTLRRLERQGRHILAGTRATAFIPVESLEPLVLHRHLAGRVSIALGGIEVIHPFYGPVLEQAGHHLGLFGIDGRQGAFFLNIEEGIGPAERIVTSQHIVFKIRDAFR